jgi:hypothetical protein
MLRVKNDYVMYCLREYGVEDLKHSTETSDLLDRITYYQMQYDELREFTHNEKEVYEEFFNTQVQVSELHHY